MSLLPSFPSSPTNGQVATVGDYSYTYNSTTDSWEGVLGGSSGSGTFAQVFTSSGTFTVPTGVTAVKVTVIGGGGGGGGGNYNQNGGGGGGVAVKYITGLTPGASIAATVGAAGVGGAQSTNSGITGGGTSSFGAYCSATGGAGAVAFNTLFGGTGGTGSSGDINVTGGTGGTGGSASGCGGAVSTGGAGGGSSGQMGQSGLTGYSPGNAGYQPYYTAGGAGFLGGSGGTAQVTFGISQSGGAATGYGNGGAGGNTSGGNGGNGSPGIVLVEWSSSILVVSESGSGLGYDQSWTDVSGSRNFGVTYTNTTGKPIQILVSGSTSGSGGGIQITVGGVTLPGQFAYSPSVTTVSASIIVPVGATYSAGAYGSTSYAGWHELR